MVPELEERDGAMFSGYTWNQWRDLPYGDRVYGIAHFRLSRLIQLHISDAEYRAQESARRMAEA